MLYVQLLLPHQGPAMVRHNIDSDDDFVLQDIMQNTQSRFDNNFLQELPNYKKAYSLTHNSFVDIINVHEFNGKPVVLAQVKETIFAFNTEDLINYS